MFFAHSGESQAESTQSASVGLLDTIAHQPAWVALIICVFVLVAWFAILNLFRVKFVPRLLALLPVVVVLTILFFEHNPMVATIMLSGGFILTFGLALTMLQNGK